MKGLPGDSHVLARVSGFPVLSVDGFEYFDMEGSWHRTKLLARPMNIRVVKHHRDDG